MTYSLQYRLIYIDQAIQKGYCPGIEALAKDMEVSERTIHRDLGYLRDSLGAPLKYDRNKKGYYYEQSTWNMPAIIFTEQELLALLIAKHVLLHHSKVPYEKHLRNAFNKIVNCLPGEELPCLEEIEENISFRYGASRTFDPMILDTVARALQKRDSIKIRYYSAGRDEENERVVDPYHMDNLRGDWYLIGFCHLRNEVRVFSLNRILECHKLERTFEIDSDFSYSDFIQNAFGIIHSDEPVEIAIQFWNLDARLAKERKWHNSQRIEEPGDKSVIIHLRVAGIEEVKRWVLSCGKNARIIKPEWLQDDIMRELAESLKRYKKN
ncbi:MAG: transcriptional regulator [Candidatus Eremiobacteraeota bacterium]|nr:transcriptional regulator [Candidatus Eremiobacteraeota bacterium]